MSKKVAANEDIEQAMKGLGTLIKECRGELSLRKVAIPCGIPASQLMSIENGVMAPTAEVYSKLLSLLDPGDMKNEMDALFMTIRKSPPPDVCDLIISNQNLIPVLRAMGTAKLTEKQMTSLLALIAQGNKEGDR